MREVLYQFAIIDITKEISEKDISDFFAVGEYEMDFTIYTKSPVGGKIIYNDNSIEEYDTDYIAVHIMTHNECICLMKSGVSTAIIRHLKTREDVLVRFNELVREYMSPDTYRCTVENGAMEISKDIINEIGKYFVEKNELGKWTPANILIQDCSQPKNIHKYFLMPDGQKIIKE